MRRRTILVTGSSGHLGAALVAALRDAHEVVQLDVKPQTNPELQSVGRVVVGSFTDPSVVAEAMDGVEAVIHCGAIPWSHKPYRRVIETNVLGTFNLLEEAGSSSSVEQFIYISSVVWHGLSEQHVVQHMPDYLPIDERHPSKAVDYYACSKVQAEYWCEKYAQRFHKPVVIFRPPQIVNLEHEASYKARPAYPYAYLHDYAGTTDLVDAVLRGLDYNPPDGIDRFLVHAEDQWSTTPSLELAGKVYPGIPLNRVKLAAADGFGAFVDCAHARERLGWIPHWRCLRPAHDLT